MSVVQGKISIAQGNIFWSGKFEQRWFFLEQRWFKGLKISVPQRKCRKNSVDQIFFKLNGISVDSSIALLEVALLKDLLYNSQKAARVDSGIEMWRDSGHIYM